MNTFLRVPPGFRFHPTDEELVDYYLRRKVNSEEIDLDVIKDVDLYKIEPWDLQDLCRIGTEEQNEWYFFSHKDKKYPTGTRTNRATAAGFWKATGRDKAIYSKHELIGMRKTLVFYKGRAPNGRKSDWIMHEYRLETDENGTPQEEGWAVCRAFKKRISTVNRKFNEPDSPVCYDDHVAFMQDMDFPNHHSHSKFLNNYGNTSDNFLELPILENPMMQSYAGLNVNDIGSNAMYSTQEQIIFHQTLDKNFHSLVLKDISEKSGDQVTDWRVLDKFVASQLSHEDMSMEDDDSRNLEKLEMGFENASSSMSSSRKYSKLLQPNY